MSFCVTLTQSLGSFCSCHSSNTNSGIAEQTPSWRNVNIWDHLGPSFCQTRQWPPNCLVVSQWINKTPTRTNFQACQNCRQSKDNTKHAFEYVWDWKGSTSQQNHTADREQLANRRGELSNANRSKRREQVLFCGGATGPRIRSSCRFSPNRL